ncbi:MAG: trypsin-like peptidase domain-containing protein [Candidatus Peribacteria bacterium]|nr:MAG: trypsin-like peptidase domain-containing protein [Candidatus Peribacteria bacterium]
MKKVVLLIASFLFILPVAVFAEDTSMYSVFKLEAYSFDLKTNSYQLEQYGSSVYVSNGLLYTNAHVVLDIYDEPLNNYRACKTIDFKKQPECFSVAKLLYYDTSNDLAVLKISDPKVMTASLYHGDLEIGQKVKVYGYPGNGGETITYTEGSISGYEEGLYKIDATIDAGSSGGGVFDESGRLIGISVAVKI